MNYFMSAVDQKQLRCAYKTRNITAEPKYTGAIKTYECPGWETFPSPANDFEQNPNKRSKDSG